MANISTIRSDNMIIPSNYPEMPTPGKISLLFDVNRTDLYHKLSPYNQDTFLFIKSTHPFLYRYPDEELGSMAENAMREFPFSRAIDDVTRVTKFLMSGRGVLWLGKQFLLQTGNAFNETRLYNPISPLIAAAMPLDFWAFRPQRYIDLGDVGSIVGSFLGPTVGTIFSTKTEPPPGTVGLQGLSANNQNAGKGLLRAGTVNSALVNLQNKFSVPSDGKGLGLGEFLSETIKGMFGNFIPKRQETGIKRSDQITYGLMLGSYTGNYGVFTYEGVNGLVNGVQQFWFGGSTSEIRKGQNGNGKMPLNWVKLYTDENGKPIWEYPRSMAFISGLTGEVGYSIDNTENPVKYGDHVGSLLHNKRSSKSDTWEGSDILIQHSIFVEENRKYPSKGTDKTDPSVNKIKQSLLNVITKINSTGTYNISDKTTAFVYNKEKIGYDRISTIKNHEDTEVQYNNAFLNQYRDDVRVLEDVNTNKSSKLSMGMATSYKADYINTLTVLDKDSVDVETDEKSGKLKYYPYWDDIIAFYFYDIINEKYIPFRATIHGLQESNNATWEELQFIGRADRLYSYSGFNRSLNISFTVNINSIKELAPTWQRINYLMSLIKPASYTQRKDTSTDNTNLHTRYIIPPMIMLTIGDLYKSQPIIINTIGLTVPDTALWETLNEKNSKEWSYLAGNIKAPDIKRLYGQLPKTVDMSLSCYLLEKERAIAGSANFGHAPHDEFYMANNYRSTPQIPNSTPTELHKSLVVYNPVGGS